jgi:sortase A
MLIWTERLTLAGGIAALALWAVVAVSGAVGTRVELQRFQAQKAAVQSAAAATPDLSLWSPDRIRAWRETLARESPTPLGVLRIPRIGLEVPVLAGTDEWTLNRAVGHIEDTAVPGSDGNAGIAGHRDGFFRALKDIGAGDLMELETLERVETYRVERIWIVGPDDVSVLDPTSTPAITLVTCYPFYFIGSAPQRFIVRAVRADPGARRRPSE